MIKLAALILILALGVLSAFLGWHLHKSQKKIRHLEESNKNLTKELARYSDKEPNVALTGPEKIMIGKALTCPQFKERIQEPKTQAYVRIIYKKLQVKIKESIRK